MKLVAVAMIAALVVLMLPLTAKAAEITEDLMVLTNGEVVNTSVHTTADDDVILALWATSGSYDNFSVDATNKVVTIKNLNSKTAELSTAISGWTFVFDGINEVGVFYAEDISVDPMDPSADHKTANITIDVTEGSSLTINEMGSNGDAEMKLTTGVVATPADIINGQVAGKLTREAKQDTPTTDYVINDGSTDPITAQTGKDLVIKCSGPVEHLSNVLMDGNEVAAENMSVESGSTILTLKAAYLATLAAGEHTVSFVYDDGTTVDATFTLTKTPQTGDPMATYVLVAAIAAGVATTVVIAKKKTVND